MSRFRRARIRVGSKLTPKDVVGRAGGTTIVPQPRSLRFRRSLVGLQREIHSDVRVDHADHTVNTMSVFGTIEWRRVSVVDDNRKDLVLFEKSS